MLSQAEIDALLSGELEIDSPDGETKINLGDILGDKPPSKKGKAKDRQVQPYNFWSPNRFSKEQMRAVELIHEDMAERLTTSLPTFLRTNLRTRVVHTEQGRFHDFLKDIPSSSLFHIITLAPLPGQLVLTISPEISYSVLELRLGGKNERGQTKRELTEIDQLLLRGLVEHMLNDIKASWGKLVVIEPGLEDSTVNYHWVQMVMGSERVMLISFEVTMQAATGTMNIYIPFTLLKPIAAILNPYIFISGQKERQTDLTGNEKVLQNFSKVKLPLQVILGHAQISFRELQELQTGSVVALDQKTDASLKVLVADQPRYTAKAGKKGNHCAAQITGKLLPQ